MRHRPEVLAPAGDLDSLKAAVRAGADAVYLGLPSFNARARAQNFDAATFEEALGHLHEHGVRAHVTLNTLVFDDELEDVSRAIGQSAAAGADALIVQDLGVLALARATAADLPIHASTQMTCTDASSVRVARSLGASRVVLARELSLAEMREIRAEAPDVELEVFVHGALCVAYSGQCLTSEAIGGRSANRGACAQACRLPYDLVVDDEVRDLGDRAYLLSPEDLETSVLVPDLAALGIVSFKIEGRLKGPDYVAGATRLYRRAVDALDGGPALTDEDRDLALAPFTRGSGPGFLNGVDHQRLVDGTTCDHRGLLVGHLVALERREGAAWFVMTLVRDVSLGDGVVVPNVHRENEAGGRIWELEVAGQRTKTAAAGARALVWLGPDVKIDARLAGGLPRPVYRSNDPNAERRIRALTSAREKKTRLDVHVSGRTGEPLSLEARAEDGRVARAVTDAVLVASDRALDASLLADKLGRLGETPFSLGNIVTSLPTTGIVPTGALNRARRALVTELTEGARSKAHRTNDDALGTLRARPLPALAPLPGGLIVLCRTLAQAEAAFDAGADGILLDFLELTGTGPAARALRARGLQHLVLSPPRIQKPGEEKITKYLEELAPDALLVRSLGALESESPIPRIADFSFNVTNRLAAHEVLSRNIARFVPAFDLDAGQLVKLLGRSDNGNTLLGPHAEVVVHHPMPLFHMEHCVFAALLSNGGDHRTCGRPCERHSVELRDRTGVDHPVIADVGCRNTVFHKKPQSAADLVSELRSSGVDRFRIELVNDTREQVAILVSAYRSLLDGEIDARELRARLRTEGGYGVVAGSLRVLA